MLPTVPPTLGGGNGARLADGPPRRTRRAAPGSSTRKSTPRRDEVDRRATSRSSLPVVSSVVWSSIGSSSRRSAGRSGPARRAARQLDAGLVAVRRRRDRPLHQGDRVGRVVEARRWPVGCTVARRSMRNVRQASRSRSRATRYQRRAVRTSRYGSIVRSRRRPGVAVVTRSRSLSRQARATVTSTSASPASAAAAELLGHRVDGADLAAQRRRQQQLQLAERPSAASSPPSTISPAAERRHTATATASSGRASAAASPARRARARSRRRRRWSASTGYPSRRRWSTSRRIVRTVTPSRSASSGPDQRGRAWRSESSSSSRPVVPCGRRPCARFCPKQDRFLSSLLSYGRAHGDRLDHELIDQLELPLGRHPAAPAGRR